MIGAGVFAAFGPAAQAAGSGLIIGLGLAAVVAYCNATSSARLAARHPESGGTYVYGRERLGPFWGFLAGWSFVVGKVASGAAMALTFAAYAAPGHVRPVAVAAVVALTAVNYLGIHKSAWLTRVIVGVTLVCLGVVVIACLGGGTASTSNLLPIRGSSVHGIVQAAGLLFFAFAGYARIATLGEEVREPRRTILARSRPPWRSPSWSTAWWRSRRCSRSARSRWPQARRRFVPRSTPVACTTWRGSSGWARPWPHWAR